MAILKIRETHLVQTTGERAYIVLLTDFPADLLSVEKLGSFYNVLRPALAHIHRH